MKILMLHNRYREPGGEDGAYALRCAAAQLVEPLMKVEIETPPEYQGPVIGDLSSRRGVVILDLETWSDVAVVYAMVTLAEMFGCSTTLRSMSAGKAIFTMEFERYAPCPRDIQGKVLEERKEKRAKLDEWSAARSCARNAPASRGVFFSPPACGPGCRTIILSPWKRSSFTRPTRIPPQRHLWAS